MFMGYINSLDILIFFTPIQNSVTIGRVYCIEFLLPIIVAKIIFYNIATTQYVTKRDKNYYYWETTG